jgi:glutathione S-transferase
LITLYYSPGACSLASHLALEHAGAPYTATRVLLSAGAQRTPEYLAINPKGRVPALATERGILTETPAILQFIAQSFPAAGLAPLDDPFELAQMNAFNSYLCSTVHVAHAHKARGRRWVDDPAALEAMTRNVPHTVGAAFALIEDGMLRGPWVMGERFSVADYYLLTMARWLEGDAVDLGRVPRVLGHRARMLELPVVRRVLAAEES